MNLHVVLTNDISEVQRLKTAFAEFGKAHRCSAELIQDIHLVLEEAVSNIIFYGYPDALEDQAHRIDVDFTFEQHCLLLEIRDDAAAFDPLSAPEPDLDIPFEEREIGGIGIHLVKSLMDELVYARIGHQNVLTMKKFLSNIDEA
jgi:anti-sigma regulatory factor (Ser/Thr protein kinase)